LRGTDGAAGTPVGTSAGLGIVSFIQVKHLFALDAVEVGFFFRYRLSFVMSLLFQAIERTEEE
jgi:hypothetical protein